VTIFRLQTTIWRDSVLPRDGMTITPHFDDHGLTSDPDNLCEDLATAISGWLVAANAAQVTVKAYDAQSAPPNTPVGSAIRNSGLSPASYVPRELAVCLSFYADQNVPRRRGRLYVPPVYMSAGPETPTARPNSAWRTKVAALVPILAGLGGVDVDWVVYSRMDDVARKVTNWFVDDEWDTVRSRGLRPTARDAGTTSG
jgi:hypothetical protein